MKQSNRLKKISLSLMLTLLSPACVREFPSVNPGAIFLAYLLNQPNYEGGIAVAMIKIPSSATEIKFPIRIDDSLLGTIPANHKYMLSQTEITYEAWKKIHTWATVGGCKASGKGCYTFTNAGSKGGILSAGGSTDNSSGSDLQPVTNISWYDAIVWCNAYTEWSNTTQGTTYTVVYKNGADILRNAADTTTLNALSPSLNGQFTATGFRLPTANEWEFAARLRKDAANSVASGTPSGATPSPITIDGIKYWFTQGSSASGATAPVTDIANGVAATGAVAWYQPNSCDTPGTPPACNQSSPDAAQKSKTRKVAAKTPNALKLYDMSGNVYEWCFSSPAAPTERVAYGGSYSNVDINMLKSSNYVTGTPTDTSYWRGLRVARTQ